MKTLEQMGEHAAIAALTANLKAVGDDCAVLPMNETHDMVLTSDPLIQGVHFTDAATPEEIGHKAVCRVLSDFAAMGAEPQYLVVNVVAPPEQDFQTLEKIYAEFSNLCQPLASTSERRGKKYGAEVVGGDLAQGPVLELHVFGVGRVPKGTALLRSGAKPGDHIYVTGPLGCSQKTGKQFSFEPRLEWGNMLRESGAVTAMMDISDGLATDLRHILKASGVGAEIDSSKIPMVGNLEQALYDGEDFELLFTSSEAFDFPIIGKITNRPEELLLDGAILEAKAFEHFKE
jgi:thiamine-monophosphate kinase